MKPKVGERFGKLLVLSTKRGYAQCRCDCGALVERAYSGLSDNTMCAKCRRKNHIWRGKWNLKY